MGAITSPLMLTAHNNASEFDKLLRDVDKSHSVVFNNVAQCKDAGFDVAACEASRTSAYQIAQAPGSRLSYSLPQDCNDKHGECTTTTAKNTVTRAVGKASVTIYNAVETSYPSVAGWQAKASDISKAVPLYPLRDSNQMVRRDGKVFKPTGI